ncbi:MAG: DHH family phosphoesterase [Candidatus Micrarchaeota archaeon]
MKFSSFLSSLKKKQILILVHFGADVDALCSAAALQFLLEKKGFNSVISVPDHLNSNAKKLSFELQIKYKKNFFPESDAIILVDFNSAEMLGSLKQEFLDSKKPVFVLDHHSIPSGFSFKNFLIDEKAVSCTEIVYFLFNEMKVHLTPKISLLLLSGLVTDSAGFRVVNKNTFFIAGNLLKKTKKSFIEVTELFETSRDLSERIALLKASKRARLFNLNGFVAVSSEVGSFESSAANALIKLGADLSFVVNTKNNKTALSARANSHFLNSAKISLPEILFFLEKKFNGKSGGHAGAAGFNGEKTESEKILAECIEVTKKLIKEREGKISFKEYT